MLTSSTFHTARRNSERGANAIEFAIIFPLFIALIFLVYDMSRAIVGYSSVRSAAETGVRYAAAADRDPWTKVTTVMSSNPQSDATVFNNEVFEFGEGTSAWYQCMMVGGAGVCDGSGRLSLSPGGIYLVEAQAIAYANITLARSLGSASFPCDASIDPPGEPGCFRCFTLRGDIARFRNRFTVDAGQRRWLGKILGVRCEYDVPITTTAIFFGWVPRFMTVSGEAFIDVNHLSDALYSPNPIS